MGDTTGIAWSDATFNPWIGCRKVSAGCAHCYAEKLVNGQMGGDFRVVRRTRPENWRKPHRWNREAGRLGKRRMVFTCSLSDFFIEEADAWRPEAWEVIRATPNLVWQILTKRPERISTHLPPDWGPLGYPNVWLGTSIENRDAWARILPLSQVRGPVRFLSVEPLLGPIDFKTLAGANIDWVIVGGESGPAARPMELDWARQVRDLCVREGVPFFLKQLGGHPNKRAHEQAVLDGQTWTQMPERLALW